MRPTQRSQERLRAVAAAIGLGLAGPAVGVLVLNLAAIVIVSAGYDLGRSSPVSLLLSLIFVTLVGFGGVSLVYLWGRDLGREYVPIGVPDLRDAIWGLAGWISALLGAYVVALLFTVLVGRTQAQNRAIEVARSNPDLFLILIPASFLVIAPGEELLYRGVVQGRLREVFSAPPAIAVASAIFAVIHFFALTGGATDRLQVLVILFVPAAVLGIAYERTENLAVPLFIHGAFDATVFALNYFVVRYAPDAVDQANVFVW